MRTLHFDCYSGISGDMTVAALIDAGASKTAVESGLASLDLPIRLRFEKCQRGSFAGLSLLVTSPPPEEQPHRHLADILEILESGSLSSTQREIARKIFQTIAVAEAKVHGVGLDEVHFHEVGALDSIADIVGTAIAVDSLGIERFTSRSVPTGSGSVSAAHGLMPVPAPATAEILRGVPLAASTIKTELTTPTGAAILKVLVQEWTETPLFRVDRIGYGAGQKDFPQQANMLRVFVGETEEPSAVDSDLIWELRTNLDDVPPEVVAYCLERCLAAGALDAYLQPVMMKKTRPGIVLTALVQESNRAAVEEAIFAETGTLGIRRSLSYRTKLLREARTVETPWGPVQAKLAWREGQPAQLAPEFEDCARLAREAEIPLRHIFQAVAQQWAQQAGKDGQPTST